MGIFGRLAADGSADYVPLMRFETTMTKPHVKEMPTRFVELPAASQDLAVRRQFIVNSGVCMNRTQAGEHAGMVALTGINGKTFDMDRIDVETNLGTTEVWEVISAGMAHPFHIHGALFRILSIGGAPPPRYLVGWKDVVLVEDKVELLVAFNQSATRDHPFMYHCHILEHEEAG
jgi:FtsP/CotA-like multicopper oxidase with cupredoxin domain